jgi:hypothetical protein
VPYIGNDLQVAFPTYKNIDDISGSFNSVTTSFPLLVNGAAPVPLPINSQQCLISVGGVVQRPDDSGTEGFRLSGGNIIFAAAPTTGADFFGVILAGADYVNVGASFPSGSAAAPSITFDSDPDTGIYNTAANEIGFTTGGSLKFSISSAGQLLNNAGTAGSPSYTFTGDSNTGIYSPGVDQLALSTGGTGRLFVNASGFVGINTISPLDDVHIASTTPGLLFDETDAGTDEKRWRIRADSSTLSFEGVNDAFNSSALFMRAVRLTASTETDYLAFYTGASSERVRIDNSGRLLAGTSNAYAVPRGSGGLGSPGLQRVGTIWSDSAISSVFFGTDAGGGGTLSLARSNSTTIGDQTVAANNDVTGAIFFSASDGTNQIRAAQITAEIDGTPGTNNMPGRLVFGTTLDGSSAPVERMRIGSSGRVAIGSNTAQGPAAGLTTPAKFFVGGQTYTDTATAASGTVSHGTIVAIDNTGIAATNTGVTYTTASSLYIDGPPTAGTNVTITDAYTLFANGGYARFNATSGDIVQIVSTDATGRASVKFFTNGSDWELGARGSSATPANTFYLYDSTAAATRVAVDPSGRVLIGHGTNLAARVNTNTVNPGLQVSQATGIGAFYRYSADANGSIFMLNKSRNATIGSHTIVNNGDSLGEIVFAGSDGTDFETAGVIRCLSGGAPGANDMPGRLQFQVTADGAASVTTRHQIDPGGTARLFASTNEVISLGTSRGAGTSDAIIIGKHTATSVDNGTNCFIVWTNGNVINTNGSYGTISDLKLKENIVDASSQWDDIKALRICNYNLKEGQTHTQIGLIAQEVEEVSPGLVDSSPDYDEDGNDLGTVTKSVKTSVLYMKAVKALQEAMERIEVLEAKIAALENG